MATVKIENVDDLRRVAAEYGVECGTGKGRLPSKRLTIVLAAAKVTIVPTPYFDGSGSVHRQAKPTAGYEITARVPRREKDGSVKLSRDGNVVFNPGVRKVRLSSAQIRELTATSGRGRVSDSNTLRAAAKHAGWLTGVELDDIAGLLKEPSVTRLDSTTPIVKDKRPKDAQELTVAVVEDPVVAVDSVVAVDLDKELVAA